jgi:hypothetical protein
MAVGGEWCDGFEDFDGDGIGDGQQDGPRWVVADSSAEVDAVHPDMWDVREGVNYVAAWREGQRFVAELHARLAAAGIGEGVEFTPHVTAEGVVMVCGRVRLEPLRRLVTYLQDRYLDDLLEAQRERQEAAPKCRGPDDRAA